MVQNFNPLHDVFGSNASKAIPADEKPQVQDVNRGQARPQRNYGVRCLNQKKEVPIQTTLDVSEMAHEMCPACGGDPKKCNPKYCVK